MNLVSVIPDAPENEKLYYRDMELSKFQVYLYNVLIDAIDHNRLLLIPADIIPRRAGKSFVFEKISHERQLIVQKMSRLMRYMPDHTEVIMRGMSVRGMDGAEHVLVDECYNYEQLERTGVLTNNAVGVVSPRMPILQTDKSLEVIEDLREYVLTLIETGELQDVRDY